MRHPTVVPFAPANVATVSACFTSSAQKVVEDQQFRVAREHPRRRRSLYLPAGKFLRGRRACSALRQGGMSLPAPPTAALLPVRRFSGKPISTSSRRSLNSTGVCGKNAARRDEERRRIVDQRIVQRISPDCTGSSPNSARSSVVLPDPTRPAMTVNIPRFTVRLMSLTPLSVPG